MTALEPASGDLPGAGREGLRIEGVGWATVELDRAATALGPALGIGDGLAFEPGGDEPWLGAFGRLARPPGGPWIVLLEPSTEGRLAAFLARHGEGVAVVYVSRSAWEPPSSGLARGPLGSQRWLTGDRWGPWLIQVDRGAQPSVDAPEARGTIR